MQYRPPNVNLESGWQTVSIVTGDNRFRHYSCVSYRIDDMIRYVLSIHWSDTLYISYHLFNNKYCGDGN